MKTFKEFCADANIQEGWLQDVTRNVSNTVRGVTNRLGITRPQPQAKPKPKPQPVLAYRNYQQGFGSGKDWKPGRWTKEQEQRYGYKPVEMTYYDPTGNPTASGKPLTRTSPPSAAVPYISPTNTRPSIPFGTRFQATRAPMGSNTQSTEFEVTDTGLMGHNAPGFVNPETKFDASPTLRSRLNLTGKQMVYEIGRAHV